MFEKIRYRLLIANLLVIALVLTGFALAVRLVFVRNLKQQLTERLITLGQGAVGNAEIDNGQLQVENEFLAQKIIDKYQALEWFNTEKKLVKQQGDYTPNAPLDPQAVVEIQTGKPSIQSITLPILSTESGKLIGYVRVSQLLDEFDETVFQLDIGLGVGVIVAVILSSAGSIWLNRQAMQPIEASFHRLKQFTADASHELRSPLMAISSNVEVALKYPDGMREEDHEVMSAVISATEQMTRLTEDLLLLARTDRASTMTLAPVNLSDLLYDLVQLYHPQSENKQIELTANLEATLFLQGDFASLMRAFTNLLQNAIRYTPAGGKVKVEARRLGQQLRVSIYDTGVGIAPENLEQIFERFWRADQARSYDDGGSGLGLSITQVIIQSHGGSIEVKSTLGAGSCFIVHLPINAKA
ncbi:sensor histidine kinase [Nodosilinea nodulosa]|uniref:sensor histidine kinase n=1 Tax=Nodosilinea nodulosa TaxID=416001 RepID=UPI0002D6CE50|nr:ATP-binding protein [Nodosilinea nodulosa]